MYRPATTYTINGRRKPHRVQAKMVCAHGEDLRLHSKCITHHCDGAGLEHHEAAALALLARLGIKGTVKHGKDYAAAVGWDVCQNN
jgi:hypothetical protein